MKWRFENTGIHSGVFNMEYDEALARVLVDGTGQSTIGAHLPSRSVGINRWMKLIL